MNKSAIFKSAHALTKATVKTGDSYAVTFAAALRIVIAESKAPVLNFRSIDPQVFDSIEQAEQYAAYFNANYSQVGKAVVTTPTGLTKARMGSKPIIMIKISDEFAYEADGWCPWSTETKDGVFQEVFEPSMLKKILITRELGVI